MNLASWVLPTLDWEPPNRSWVIAVDVGVDFGCWPAVPSVGIQLALRGYPTWGLPAFAVHEFGELGTYNAGLGTTESKLRIRRRLRRGGRVERTGRAGGASALVTGVACPIMRINLSRPENLAVAPYADMAVVGHSAHGFSIDFVAIDGANEDELNGTVVCRVKVPPSVVFQIAAAIAENVDQYERKFGKITPIQPEGT